jgi:hypothetical protein
MNVHGRAQDHMHVLTTCFVTEQLTDPADQGRVPRRGQRRAAGHAYRRVLLVEHLASDTGRTVRQVERLESDAWHAVRPPVVSARDERHLLIAAQRAYQAVEVKRLHEPTHQATPIPAWNGTCDSLTELDYGFSRRAVNAVRRVGPGRTHTAAKLCCSRSTKIAQGRRRPADA